MQSFRCILKVKYRMPELTKSKIRANRIENGEILKLNNSFRSAQYFPECYLQLHFQASKKLGRLNSSIGLTCYGFTSS